MIGLRLLSKHTKQKDLPFCHEIKILKSGQVKGYTFPKPPEELIEEIEASLRMLISNYTISETEAFANSIEIIFDKLSDFYNPLEVKVVLDEELVTMVENIINKEMSWINNIGQQKTFYSSGSWF